MADFVRPDHIFPFGPSHQSTIDGHLENELFFPPLFSSHNALRCRSPKNCFVVHPVGCGSVFYQLHRISPSYGRPYVANGYFESRSKSCNQACLWHPIVPIISLGPVLKHHAPPLCSSIFILFTDPMTSIFVRGMVSLRSANLPQRSMQF